MNANEKRERLRLILSDVFLVHCAGCDEWGCGGEKKSGFYHEPEDDLLDQIIAEVATWGEK